jgi:TPR repeat protein
MGKSLPLRGKLKDFARAINSGRPKSNEPVPARDTRIDQYKEPQKQHNQRNIEAETQQKRLNSNMEVSSSVNRIRGVPLAEVVVNCARRWFSDSLKQAKAGDRAMQVIVGQMYASGYGVPQDTAKAKEWIKKASSSRHASWNVLGKQPGYIGSDSMSESDQNDGN